MVAETQSTAVAAGGRDRSNLERMLRVTEKRIGMWKLVLSTEIHSLQLLTSKRTGAAVPRVRMISMTQNRLAVRFRAVTSWHQVCEACDGKLPVNFETRCKFAAGNTIR